MLSILIASNIPVVFQLLIIIDDPDACDSTMRMWFIVVKRNYMLISFTLRPCFNLKHQEWPGERKKTLEHILGNLKRDWEPGPYCCS